MKFIDKKINDVCYFVTLKRIEEYKIRQLVLENGKLSIRLDGYFSLQCDIDSTIAKSKSGSACFYADLGEAKHAMHELRNNEMKRLFKEMTAAISAYQIMSSCLIGHNDVNYTDEEWENLLKN